MYIFQIFYKHISFNIYYFHNQKKLHYATKHHPPLPFTHMQYTLDILAWMIPKKPSAVTAVPTASELYHMISHLQGLHQTFMNLGTQMTALCYRPILKTTCVLGKIYSLEVKGLYEMSSSFVSSQMVGDMHRYFET